MSARSTASATPRRAHGGGESHVQAVRGRAAQAEMVEAKPDTAQREANGGRLAFVKEFLRSPLVLGTCFTSSPALSRRIADCHELARAKVVVEVGSGTGALTRDILARISPGCRFFGIEKAESLAAEFGRRFPGVKLHCADAADIRALLKKEGLPGDGSVDCVVSSLPWTVFPRELQLKILRECWWAMKPGATFSALTYRMEHPMAGARVLRQSLEEVFAHVERRKIVWRNIPPAFVYRCVK